MKRLFFIMMAAVMVLSSMASCGGGDKSDKTPLESAETQAEDVVMDEELAEIIDEAGTIGEGTAGSSLKKAKIAHDLAALAAEKGYTEEDIETLKSTFAATMNAMDEDADSSVKSAFENSVFPMLDSMINEGESDMYKGLLEDAGVGGDMDSILNTPGLAESYNSIKSAYPFN
ncbi:MAG: hypothetical protein II828_01585 [Clostridia bacterium]|nr:hypothetical protein [Clostridia bacterium]